MTYSDRTQLELDKLAAALATLYEAASANETPMVRDSLLLRFVYTFEMAWQTMRLVLQERGDTETPRLAFAVLQTAFKAGMIEDAALWKEIRDSRNGVSHAYDEGFAVRLAAFVRDKALPEFDRLLASLQNPA